MYNTSSQPQPNTDRKHVYHRLGLLGMAQILSQLGIERYASTAILRVLTDVCFHRLEAWCIFLKEASIHVNTDPDLLWETIIQGEETEGLEERNEDIEELFLEQKKRLDRNVLLKQVVNMDVGYSRQTGFMELGYYLQSQLSWARSLSNMLVNKNVESSLTSQEGGNQGILFRQRMGRKMLPPEALLSLIKTCPISQKEKKRDGGDREQKQYVPMNGNKYEQTYNQFIEASGLEDIREDLPPVPFIRDVPGPDPQMISTTLESSKGKD